MEFMLCICLVYEKVEKNLEESNELFHINDKLCLWFFVEQRDKICI